jgi:arginase family enzyme
MTRTILSQVRELLDRHLDILEISERLHIDLETVRAAADIIKELIT